MASLIIRTLRFFILDFGIVAFNTVIDLLLAELCLINRDFTFSTYLLVPDVMLHHWQIPNWNYWVGCLFFFTGLARYLGVIFQFRNLLTVTAALSFLIWLSLVNLFLSYASIFAVFPVAEVHFSFVMAYGNMMLFLRYCIGYARVRDQETEGKPIIY